jgi:hypothetical protein
LGEDGDDVERLVTRHLRAGLWGLFVFVLLGAVLETLHATKAPSFVDAGQETARMLLRLAHAHGTLVSLVHVVYALAVRARPALATPTISACLLAALVLLPAGFLLGGLRAHGGDPGLGIVLVPPGAVALAAGIALAARRVSASPRG